MSSEVKFRVNAKTNRPMTVGELGSTPAKFRTKAGAESLLKSGVHHIEWIDRHGRVVEGEGREMKTDFTFADVFAGIGGFRIGLTKAGGRCVFTCEKDRYARQTYEAWYGCRDIHPDANTLDPDTIPDHDILAAGFPCQPFSIAGIPVKNSLGQSHGFKCEKHGNLFFRLCDIAACKRPKVLFFENVKNLLHHDGGRSWQTIRNELDAIDYEVFHAVINAFHWVPQSRSRVLIVAFDRREFGKSVDFKFPITPMSEPVIRDIRDILDTDVDPKYTLSDRLWTFIQAKAGRMREKGNGFRFGLVGPGGISRTLTARYGKDGSEILIRQEGRNPRRLTPREAARLMGFNEENARLFGHPNGFPQVVSDTQAYRQFGNAVVPDMIEHVARAIIKVLNGDQVYNKAYEE